ncbi:hypothetical protein SDJN03_28938, partial [Cucurbita argyrosperma subsp. sororia]
MLDSHAHRPLLHPTPSTNSARYFCPTPYQQLPPNAALSAAAAFRRNRRCLLRLTLSCRFEQSELIISVFLLLRNTVVQPLTCAAAAHFQIPKGLRLLKHLFGISCAFESVSWLTTGMQ